MYILSHLNLSIEINSEGLAKNYILFKFFNSLNLLISDFLGAHNRILWYISNWFLLQSNLECCRKFVSHDSLTISKSELGVQGFTVKNLRTKLVKLSNHFCGFYAQIVNIYLNLVTYTTNFVILYQVLIYYKLVNWYQDISM